ncbi:hypothetical protein B0H10DRAFT_2302808 [Mycena sp. CBHHK59/15]|nr:hypothetical protein B0H10DRAFT_2302808 [Mycena sp. CBHHK59/15]
MLHFPSSGGAALPRRTDSLNATQTKAASSALFLAIEQELHDARRVRSHGQEEDLRAALGMVINRVSELSALLGEVYKSKAELEVQLNVAKSNLQLVISNNEMLEEALKAGGPGARDVGWRRWSAREGEQRSVSGASIDHERPASVDPYTANGAAPPAKDADSPTDGSRFFKFRFAGGDAPVDARADVAVAALEELAAELERERTARAAVAREKAALEAEIESLSQALFEEANRMVASERIRRAETEAELVEARQEKEALRSALRVIEGENVELRSSGSGSNLGSPRMRSRSSSSVGIKSPPGSPTRLAVGEQEEEEERVHATPRRRGSLSLHAESSSHSNSSLHSTSSQSSLPSSTSTSTSSPSPHPSPSPSLQSDADPDPDDGSQTLDAPPKSQSDSKSDSEGESPPPTALYAPPEDPWADAPRASEAARVR